MIKVTPKATLAVAEYCHDKKKSPIRIYLKIGGCGIRSFGLTLETAQPSDKIFEIDGYTYIIDPKLLTQYGPIKINSDGFSFRISGNGIHPPTGCETSRTLKGGELVTRNRSLQVTEDQLGCCRSPYYSLTCFLAGL